MGFFSRKPKVEEDKYIELGQEVYDITSELSDKVKIAIFTLEKFDDVRQVNDAFSKGDTICLVSIGRLVDLEFGEPHMAVKKMKQAVEKQNGDIAAIKGNWIVMTPAFGTIHRKVFSNIHEAISKELN